MRTSTARAICSVTECSSTIRNKGLCSKHYQRKQKYGDPLISKYNRGEGDNQIQRFQSRIRMAGDDDCHLWVGFKTGAGYGQTTFNGRKEAAHRIAFYLATGTWPLLFVLHSCDTPACVNPRHLREGTNQDNTNDKIARGRVARGSDLPHTKLTNETVIQIREMHATGNFTQASLGRQFDVAPSIISRVVNRKRWQHV